MPALSPREREALQLLAQGMSYKQIACTMGIATRTLKSYLYRARGKLGCPTVVSAVAVSVFVGIVILAPLDDMTKAADCVTL